jgi:hypothetical protein
VKWKVSWRQPRPELGCRAKGKKSESVIEVPHKYICIIDGKKSM